jgi:CelD/BcsL family acetyltransferase involved in cellulose biosynthesis
MVISATLNLPHSLGGNVLRHQVRRIECVDELLALGPAWRALAAGADDCPAHMTFEYGGLAASRMLAEGAAITAAMVWRDRELVALWPVSIVQRGPLRVAKSLTCGSGEECGGPLVKAADSDVYECAVAAIMQIDADVLEIPMVRHGSSLQIALEAVPQSWVSALIPQRWRSMPGYSISLREFEQWDDFVRTRPKSLRATLRRRHKRLEERGHVEFGWCQSASDAASVLTWLFDNKRRWAIKRGFKTPYLMNDRARDFFIALANRTDPSSRPLVAFVKVDGVPVAATVNLVGSQSVESFMTTYDEAFSQYSAGNLLTEYQAKWSHAHGLDLDLRAFYADYKLTWANRQSRYQTRLVFLRPRGRLIEPVLLSAQIVRAKRKLFRVAASLLEDWRGKGSSHAD